MSLIKKNNFGDWKLLSQTWYFKHNEYIIY